MTARPAWLTSLPTEPGGRLDVAAVRAILDDLDTEQNRAELRGAPSALLNADLVRHANIKAGTLGPNSAVYVFVTEPSALLPNTAIKVGSTRSMARRYKDHMSSGLATTLHRHSGIWPFLGPHADFDTVADASEFLRSDSYLLVFEIDTNVDDWHRRMQRLEVTARACFRPLTEGAGSRTGRNPLDLAGLARSLIGGGSAH